MDVTTSELVSLPAPVGCRQCHDLMERIRELTAESKKRTEAEELLVEDVQVYRAITGGGI
jgi:hypothetical protein